MSLYQLLTEQRAALVSLRAVSAEPIVEEGVTDLIARTDELLAATVKGEKVRAYLNALPVTTDDIPEGFGVATVGGMLQ